MLAAPRGDAFRLRGLLVGPTDAAAREREERILQRPRLHGKVVCGHADLAKCQDDRVREVPLTGHDHQAPVVFQAAHLGQGGQQRLVEGGRGPQAHDLASCGRFGQARRRVGGDDAPRVDERHLVAQVLGLLHVMGHEHGRDPSVPHRPDDRLDSHQSRRTDPRRRLGRRGPVPVATRHPPRDPGHPRVLWLVDTVLQLQPFMFTAACARKMLAAAGAGQPAWVAGRRLPRPPRCAAPGTVGRRVRPDPARCGYRVSPPALVRPAIVGSLAWSAGIWWFGEGLGGVALGQAHPARPELRSPDGSPGRPWLGAPAAWPSVVRCSCQRTRGLWTTSARSDVNL